MRREGNQQPNLLPFGKSIDSLKLTEYQPVADDQQTREPVLLSEAWLGQFAFLELWAGLPAYYWSWKWFFPQTPFPQVP